MERIFKVLSQEIKYQNPWLTVKELITEKDGKKGIYGIVERANAVTLIIETEDNKILLLKQYRFPTNSYSWELPMGGIDGNETPNVSALRELAEETGISTKIEKIGEFHPVPGLTPQKAFVFYGNINKTDVDLVNTNQETVDEIVERKFFSYNEISEMIKDNLITDGFTLTSLSIFKWA